MSEHEGKVALRRMVETASKATPGPWESDITQGGIGGQVCRNECVVAARDLVCFLVARRGTQTGRQWAHDGNHIAAANPTSVQQIAAYVAELEAREAELRDLLDDAQPQNTEDCAYNAEWDRRRIAVLARTAPKDQCRVDVGGYPCEEPRPCAEHDRTAPKDSQP